MRDWQHGGCNADMTRVYSCKLCNRPTNQTLRGMEADKICPWCAQSLGVRICEGLDETPPCNLIGSPDDWAAYKLEKSPHLIAHDVRQEVLKRDNYECQHCASTEKLHLDHRLPHSRGGKSTEDNLWVLCASCNTSKRNKTVEEWLARGGNRSKAVAA